jgi:EXLDI family protein
VAVPNKTIYVSDGDLKLYERAQKLAGGNLSAAIAKALKRYVETAEGLREGFDDVVVRVGVGAGRKVRFTAVLVGEWTDTINERDRAIPRLAWPDRQVRPAHRTAARLLAARRRGQAGRWLERAGLGIGVAKYRGTPKEQILEVLDSLEQLRDKVPPELYDIVARDARQPTVEESTSEAAHRQAPAWEVHDERHRGSRSQQVVRQAGRPRFDRSQVPEGTVFALLGPMAPARRPRSTSSRR